MEVMRAIESRRSERKYGNETVKRTAIEKMLSLGTLAPSGKNGQPWRFAVIHEDKELLHKVAECTVYKNFVQKADCLICVFMDKTESYHYVKDCQAIGACIQNMLLAATELNLGACWIGEILNRDTEVKRILGINNRYDLMAVIAVGSKIGKESKRTPRKSAGDCMLFYR